MAHSMAHRTLKQRCLTKIEIVNWRQNLLYTVYLDGEFAPFLLDGAEWEKKSRKSLCRRFLDDADTVPEAQRRTKERKCW